MDAVAVADFLAGQFQHDRIGAELRVCPTFQVS